jgi:murein DD-endopeptidase MepM/ murein hydrolase activator NlpD
LIGFGCLLPAQAAVLAVAPGTVVRWPGDGLERCALADRSWLPLGGECWYPIDLLQPVGPLTVTRWRRGERQEIRLRVEAYPYEVQTITLADDSQVNLSAEDLRRVKEENRRIAALWDRVSPRRFELPLAPPLDPLPTGGRFGARRVLNDQPRSPHSGADYAVAAGTPVTAVADGTVVLTGDFFFSGGSVFIDHGDALISMYFHLSGVAVEEGDQVKRGEIVGLAGATGRATGAHLHFGVRWHRARVDPGLLQAPVDEIRTLP